MKVNKKILIAAGIITVSGAVVSGAAAVFLINSSAESGRIVTQTIDEDISKIDISVKLNDVRLISAATDKISVDYTDGGLKGCNIVVNGDTLEISNNTEEKAWYDYIGLDFGRDGDITVIVPENMSIDARIKTMCGDIETEGLGGSLRADVGNGDVEISNCDFNILECNAECGDVELKDSGGETIICNINYGDIECERLRGSNIKLYSDCGDIEGFVSGDEADYTINTDVLIGENRMRNRTGGKNILDVKTNTGDITLRFIN